MSLPFLVHFLNVSKGQGWAGLKAALGTPAWSPTAGTQHWTSTPRLPGVASSDITCRATRPAPGVGTAHVFALLRHLLCCIYRKRWRLGSGDL